MMGNREQISDWSYLRGELRYYAALGCLVLMLPLSLVALLWMLPTSHASEEWDEESANGTLYVRGALTESACRLEMESARQDIWLGAVATGRLTQPGARGEPIGFELRLRDCLRSPANTRDERTGALNWALNQPAVTVSFSAPADADNPQLVKAQGVSGLGLRLLDQQGRDVRLGSRGVPLWLSPGQNALRYSVIPERTAATLAAGSYRAAIDFRLSYD